MVNMRSVKTYVTTFFVSGMRLGATRKKQFRVSVGSLTRMLLARAVYAYTYGIGISDIVNDERSRSLTMCAPGIRIPGIRMTRPRRMLSE